MLAPDGVVITVSGGTVQCSNHGRALGLRSAQKQLDTRDSTCAEGDLRSKTPAAF
jgi:hypothetical protein